MTTDTEQTSWAQGSESDGIGPARRQFIERTFADLLGWQTAAAGSAGEREDWIWWAHQRLFVEGATAEMVRLEWTAQIHRVRVVAVTSGKGGVGKTTFSVNLAAALAQRGLRVLLFDADLGMANVHVFAGVNPRQTLLDVVDQRATLAEVMVAGPAGVQLICGPSGVGRLSDLPKAELESLGRELLLVAADFDVLLLDTGAGISATVMHFLGLAHEAIVVATPNLAATLDAYGVIKTAHEQRIGARMHVLINLAEDQAQATRVHERISGCAQRFLQTTPASLGVLWRNAEMERANQSRQPLVLGQPRHENAQRIAQYAAALHALWAPPETVSPAA